jgi:hypothetical protein
LLIDLLLIRFLRKNVMPLATHITPADFLQTVSAQVAAGQRAVFDRGGSGRGKAFSFI